MSRHRFSTGTRFRWQGATYEVVRLLPQGQINLEDMFTGAVSLVSLSELVTALFEDQLLFAVEGNQANRNDPALINTTQPYTDLADCPQHLVAVARYRLMVIEPLLKMERPGKDAVKVRVQELKAAKPDPDQRNLSSAVSVASIYRWLKDYRRSGYDLRALIPNTHQRGGQGQSRLSQPVNALITAAIRDTSGRKEKVAIDDIWHEVASQVEEENRLLPPPEQLSLPSRRTIARRMEKFDLERRLARLPPQYGLTPYPEVPLERVEIDETKTDMIVIDDRDNLPLGRLTLTYALDTATRFPLGYYLGFEPPSYLAVMECLYHAIRPKENVRERYGTEHDWIAYGLPTSLVIDNGKEFIGRDLQDACLLLGIILQQTKVRTPEFKAGVERALGTVNRTLLHKLPGTTFSNPQQRGDYDSVKQACVTLSEIDRVLNIFIVDIYAQQFHRGLNGIPARRWEAATGGDFFSPGLPPNAQELAVLLGRVDYRSLHSYGIEFLSLRYNCADLAALRTRLKDKKQVKFKYHPADMSCIYVHDPFETEPLKPKYIKVPALDEGYTQGLSLWKHRVIRNLVLSEQDRVDLAALGRAKRKIQDIVEAGRSRQRLSTRTYIARWDGAGQTPSRASGAPEASIDRPELPPLSPPPLPEPGPADVSPILDQVAAEDWEIVYPASTQPGPMENTLEEENDVGSA
jgi:putative transposase